ncbi:unnamed protein product, partial [Brassica napus]
MPCDPFSNRRALPCHKRSRPLNNGYSKKVNCIISCFLCLQEI